MYPVTGPTTLTTTSGSSPYSWCKIREIRKQVKPYNLNLPYKATHWKRTAQGPGTKHSAGSYSGSVFSNVTVDTTGDPYYSYFTSYQNSAITKAIKKFNAQQAARASLGVTMAQSRQALSMMSARVEQAYKVFKSLKRFDVKGACDALGLSIWKAKKIHKQWVRAGKRGPYTLRNEDIWNPDTFHNHRKARQRATAVSDLWLEFSFGWIPLVGDIHTAMEVLSDFPYYTEPIRAGGSTSFSFENKTRTTTDFWYYDYSGKHSCKIRCSVGGVLTVTNSNSNLLSRLGIVNLAQIAYEVVTLSFVVNYFVNVEEYLNQFSQYDGVTVSQAWYTIKWVDDLVHLSESTHRPSGAKTVRSSYSAQGVSVVRTVGSLPTIKIGMRPSYFNGVKRGLNNAALLVQLLRNPR